VRGDRIKGRGGVGMGRRNGRDGKGGEKDVGGVQ
jgi:hypothetical protein